MVVMPTGGPSAASRMSEDRRPGGVCPLCGGSSVLLERFAFAPKPHLPTVIRFEFCESCNFIFAGDLLGSAYARHYASVLNDGQHVVVCDDPESDDRLQAGNLEEVLSPDFAGAVLDFGCGQGRLLHRMARRFPRASLYGHDVVDYIREPHDIRFLRTLEDIPQRFDLIVVSHVVEHLVSFAPLRRLVELLEPDGLLYIEVPDPSGYIECRRREFMYYFDRLHINHFSRTTMWRLLANLGMSERRHGTHRFRYRDGHYPAAWCIAGRTTDGANRLPAPGERALDALYRAYFDEEKVRARVSRRRLNEAVDEAGILVYGAGDNFRRARWAGGPLDGVPLLAVIDRRADQMPPEDGIRFERPEVALERFPTAPVVVTVSEEGGAIAAMLRASYPDRAVFFV